MLTHLKFFEKSTAKATFQKLASTNESTLVNYNFDESCNSIQYGVKCLNDIKEDIFYSGPMVGCHLVIGALNDKSFMAHNNEDPNFSWAKDQTKAMIEAHPSGSYYLFFTSAAIAGNDVPETYIQAMEKTYGITFSQVFYYDETESPRKSWVEVSYHSKNASLQVSGFRMTYPDKGTLRYDCPLILLSQNPHSQQVEPLAQDTSNNKSSYSL